MAVFFSASFIPLSSAMQSYNNNYNHKLTAQLSIFCGQVDINNGYALIAINRHNFRKTFQHITGKRLSRNPMFRSSWHASCK